MRNIKNFQQYLLFYHSPKKIFLKIAHKLMSIMSLNDNRLKLINSAIVNNVLNIFCKCNIALYIYIYIYIYKMLGKNILKKKLNK